VKTPGYHDHGVEPVPEAEAVAFLLSHSFRGHRRVVRPLTIQDRKRIRLALWADSVSERMTLVDRNILRLGAYELSPGSDIPVAVAINEAVELGKRFGSEESGAFINGILHRISELVRKKIAAEGAA